MASAGLAAAGPAHARRGAQGQQQRQPRRRRAPQQAAQRQRDQHVDAPAAASASAISRRPQRALAAPTPPIGSSVAPGDRRARPRRRRCGAPGSAPGGRSPARTARADGAARPASAPNSSAGSPVAAGGGCGQQAEPVQRLGRGQRRRRRPRGGRRRRTAATSRRSMSTNRPDSGRSDQSALAVTWNSTIRPAPARGLRSPAACRRPARAQVRSARSRARLGQHLAGHLHLVRHRRARRTASRRGTAASPAGWLQDIAPPSWRSPASSRTGSSVSVSLLAASAVRGPAKRISSPPLLDPVAPARRAPAPSGSGRSARTSTERSRFSSVRQRRPRATR